VSFLLIKETNLKAFEEFEFSVYSQKDLNILRQVILQKFAFLENETPIPKYSEQWVRMPVNIRNRIAFAKEVLNDILLDLENLDTEEQLSGVGEYFYTLCELDASKLFFLKPSLHILTPIHEALCEISSTYRNMGKTYNDLREGEEDFLYTCESVNSKLEGYYQMYKITSYTEDLYKSALLVKASFEQADDETLYNLDTFLNMLKMSLEGGYVLLAVRPVLY